MTRRNERKQGWVFPLFSTDSDVRLSLNFYRFVILYRSCVTLSVGRGHYCLPTVSNGFKEGHKFGNVACYTKITIRVKSSRGKSIFVLHKNCHCRNFVFSKSIREIFSRKIRIVILYYRRKNCAQETIQRSQATFT